MLVDKWCDKCGSPGPFKGKICLTCKRPVDMFVTDLLEAYKLWLDFKRENVEVNGETLRRMIYDNYKGK